MFHSLSMTLLNYSNMYIYIMQETEIVYCHNLYDVAWNGKHSNA
jgi:hypothetical protein